MKKAFILALVFGVGILFGAAALGYSIKACAIGIMGLAVALGFTGTILDRPKRIDSPLVEILNRHRLTRGINQ